MADSCSRLALQRLPGLFRNRRATFEANVAFVAAVIITERVRSILALKGRQAKAQGETLGPRAPTRIQPWKGDRPKPRVKPWVTGRPHESSP